MSKFTVIIHRDKNGFWAEVPALPGCYSQGETIDELLDHIKEAIEGVLEVMASEGKKPESDIQVVELAV